MAKPLNSDLALRARVQVKDKPTHMNTHVLFDEGHGKGALGLFLLCVLITVASMILASVIQTDFGRLEVSNVTFSNYNGIPIRAKLLRPKGASERNPMPGIVYIHGYQNNRETGDAYCIELARRGFVVLNIDAIGRGNSGIPNAPSAKDFDPTYGGRSSFEYLRSLPFVKPDSAGMMGHSLGAEMAYEVALKNPNVRALVITGFAYREDATRNLPKNMLMILGKWDEFRERMTGTRDIEKEWMGTKQTENAFPVRNPKFDETYGSFTDGSARRVFIPATIHIQESHSSAAIARAVQWMKNALQPSDKYWIAPSDQIWQVKEWATLIAMLSCIWSLLPLGLLLLRTSFLQTCSRFCSRNLLLLNPLLLPVCDPQRAAHVAFPSPGLSPFCHSYLRGSHRWGFSHDDGERYCLVVFGHQPHRIFFLSPMVQEKGRERRDHSPGFGDFL